MERTAEVVKKNGRPGGKKPARRRLPGEFSKAAVLVEWLMQTETWQKLEKRFHINRKAGGYVAPDFVLFLLLFFAFSTRLSLKDFGKRTAPYRRELGALCERVSLATPSSLSRGLQRVTPEQVRELMPWLLTEACNARDVLRHPAAADYDTQGQRWDVFDWDGTRKGIRQRALVDDADYPAAERPGAQLGRPGYTGRKRGELVLGRAVLSHTGSGLWIYEHQTAGHAETVEGLTDALDALVQTLHYAELPRDRAVLRYDGGGGNVPSLCAIRSRDIVPLVRLATYTLLHDPDITETLQQARWVDVSCSGSGPVRQAIELGIVRVTPSSKTRNENKEPYEPVDIRVVVSRFACPEGKSGTGHEIDGYQYELFATDLENELWPAPDVVTLYYGREGEENRFAQEDRELGLDRILSETPGGQYLATLVGLWTWNLEICHGYALDPPPTTMPKPSGHRDISTAASPCIGTLPSAPGLAVHEESTDNTTLAEPSFSREAPGAAVSDCSTKSTEPATPEPGPKAASNELPVIATSAPDDEAGARLEDVLRPVLEQAIADQKLPDGWTLSEDGRGLICPQAEALWLGSVKLPTTTAAPAIRMQASNTSCGPCPRRAHCGRALSPRFAKEVMLPVPANLAHALHELLAKERNRRFWQHRPVAASGVASASTPAQRPKLARTHRIEAPPCDVVHGPFATRPPLLLPAVLRQTFRQTVLHIDVIISVNTAAARKWHPAIARSSASRQRRRQTWPQQGRHMALAAGSSVKIEYQDGSRRLDPWLRRAANAASQAQHAAA